MEKILKACVLSLVLSIPTWLTAQSYPPYKDLLGNRIHPSESYIFAEGDGMIIPVGFTSGYYNLSLGWQANAWLGLGVHFNGVWGSGISYRGFGVTYRLAYKFIHARLDLGLVQNYRRAGGDFCYYYFELDSHPYLNGWLGIRVWNEFRLGIHFSRFFPTVDMEEVCWFRNVPTTRNYKGGEFFVFPSIGFSAPLARLNK